MLTSALVLLCSAVALSSAAEPVVLTDANFVSEVGQAEEKPVFVKFYAPWCGHCKALVPTWDKLAEETDFTVGKVDCTVEKGVCTSYGVRGYPTLKLFSKGQVFDYKGGRSEDVLSAWAKEGYTAETGAPLKEIKPYVEKAKAPEVKFEGESKVVVLTEQNFYSEIASKSSYLVEFYAPWCGHCKRLVPTWNQLSVDAPAEVGVGKVDATVQKKLGKSFGVSGFPTVLLFKDGSYYEFNGSRSVDGFLEFAKTGYTEEKASPVPEAPVVPHPAVAFLMEQGKMLVNDFEELQKYRKNALAVTFAAGALFGMLFCCCCCGGRKSSGKAKTE